MLISELNELLSWHAQCGQLQVAILISLYGRSNAGWECRWGKRNVVGNLDIYILRKVLFLFRIFRPDLYKKEVFFQESEKITKQTFCVTLQGLLLYRTRRPSSSLPSKTRLHCKSTTTTTCIQELCWIHRRSLKSDKIIITPSKTNSLKLQEGHHCRDFCISEMG